MQDYEYAERLGSLLRQAREKKNVSSVDMSKRMGLSRKTIDNWENAISSPDIAEMFKWFRVIDENPGPYLKEYLYPGCNDTQFSKDTLLKNLDSLSVRELEIINYYIAGDHGSSTYAFLNLGLCHLLLSVGSKQLCATMERLCFLNDQARDALSDPNAPEPDLYAFSMAIHAATEAYRKNQAGYAIDHESYSDALTDALSALSPI